MQYKFVIPGKLPGMNEYTSANRRNRYVGGQVKSNSETRVVLAIQQQLRELHINVPVIIYYHFYEPNRRRDSDNILACASKFVQDALVKAHVLQDDNQKCVYRFYFDTDVDKENPRIEVVITEITPEQQHMGIADILKSLNI